MFLISKHDQACAAFRVLADRLCKYARGTTVEVAVGDYVLRWLPLRPADNLHLFRNGAFVGKLSYTEAESAAAISHDGNLPAEFHPLLPGVAIRQSDGQVDVEPQSVTPVFATDVSASDKQLLLAGTHGLKPNPMQFNLLASAGYFAGCATLFDVIRKIPLASRRRLGSDSTTVLREFEPRKQNDDALLERLQSIIPDAPSQIGLSGGYDSRFVLGLLLSRGIRPRVVYSPSGETPVIVALSKELSLEASEHIAPRLDPRTYTMATDGQIYFSGGNYSRLRNGVSRDALYYTGLFSDSLLKNPYKAAWKLPGVRRSFLTKLAGYAYLGLRSRSLTGVKHWGDADSMLSAARLQVDHLSQFESAVPRSLSENSHGTGKY